MSASSISETKRIRYLLGLSSPAERELIESEYFEDDDAFQEMLTAEDDLIDACARGELTHEERRKVEKTFANSLRGRDRVHFARAFAGAVSATGPVEPKLPVALLDIFKIFRSPGMLRTATVAAVIVFVAVLAWLVSDRRRMTNELRELRAESAELSKRTEALQRSSDTERTRSAEIAAQLATLQAQPNKPRHREHKTTAAQRARHLPEVKHVREKFEMIKAQEADMLLNSEDATLGNNFVNREITQLPLNDSNVATLLSLLPGVTRDGYVAGGRADQANLTLDGVSVARADQSDLTLAGVSVEQFKIQSLVPRNTSNGVGTIVRGTVKDSNGNVVSGATVTLTDPARNFTRTKSTNEDGTYVFDAITPGTYSFGVTARGFKTASASGLDARIDTPTIWDVQLEIGDVSETVNVTAASAEAAINTSDATLGSSFVPKRITELPLNANDVVGLLSLQPGVTRIGFQNGGLADQSNITSDGVGTTIRIPSTLSWIRFQLALETSAIHEDYRVTIKTAGGASVTSINWNEPLTPNQIIINTPVISTGDVPSGDYVLLLMGKEPDGSFIKVAEYFFKVIKY